MSLNGLDVNAVVEAHQSALADPGGWFLLKYVNRDTVDVLSRGNGGIAEAKSAVEQYQEKSPLFGMVQYRRKKALLKFVPDGTSRLMQVRLTVQFQSVLDAFSHDTIFTFTAPAELTESSIGMCTMLLPVHPGSSIPSNSSARQRRLNEISEDDEDTNVSPKEQETQTLSETVEETKRTLPEDDLSTLPASALRAKAMLAKRREESRNASLASNNIDTFNSTSQPTPQPVLYVETAAAVAEPPRSLSSLSQLKARDEADYTASSIRSITQSPDQRSKRFHHSRHLSENESESISQWNDQVTAYIIQDPPTKPKKKLAPRPHIEDPARPRTANQYDEGVIPRPVASLPQSIRVSNRPTASTHSIVRPGSQQSSRSFPTRFLHTPSLPPPLPELGSMESFSLFKRPESRQAGSIVSSTITDAPNASPEKLRLMKALQKRKRTQLLSSRATSAQSSYTIYQDEPSLERDETKTNAKTVQKPTTIVEEAPSALNGTKSAIESSTASPTSIGTMSDNPSTRPSSFADDRQSQSSQKSASRDTDSSSTPKAIAQYYDSPSENHGGQPELLSDASRNEDETIAKQEAVESGGAKTPTLQSPWIGEAQNSGIGDSSLATQSELDVLGSLLNRSEQRASDRHLKVDTLGVDALPSPVLTSSSVISDDDAFDEELRSVTVHEAKSMSVSRPPLTPTMRTLSIDKSRPGTRSGVTLTPQSSRSKRSIQDKSPGGMSDRNLSTALPQYPQNNDDEQTPAPLSKKTTLGHGISQRIKALEDSSRRDISQSSSTSVKDPSLGRSTFSNLMKRASIIAQFQTPATSTEKPASEEMSNAKSSVFQASIKPTAARASVPHNVVQTGVEQNRDSVESRPTTAKTVRRPLQLDHSKIEQTELYNSQPTTPRFSLFPDTFNTPFEMPSTPSSEKKRYSFASYRSGTTTPTTRKRVQPESMARKLSVTTKDSRFTKLGGSETSSINEEKRASRTSRLMKRVSGFGSRFGSKGLQASMNREEVRPDPIIEQNEFTGRPDSTACSVLQMIDIGNVNVQFPESLLWKRRFLRIDDQGYLIFQAPTETQNGRATSRKFHLGDIQEPCLPDLEREEMAWSVLLDLRDGNCIQCACESKKGQKKVLNMLLDAHSAYHSIYPDTLE